MLPTISIKLTSYVIHKKHISFLYCPICWSSIYIIFNLHYYFNRIELQKTYIYLANTNILYLFPICDKSRQNLNHFITKSL
jgi:hypothetical protein